MPEPKRNDKKSSRFSLKWFLRKTKPSQTEKIVSKAMPKSKSCDVHFSSIVPGKDCGAPVPYVQIQRKISASALCSQFKVPDPIHIFKTSYSSNDVQGLAKPYGGNDCCLNPASQLLLQRAGPATLRTEFAKKGTLSPDSCTSGEELGACGPNVGSMVQCRLCLSNVNFRELYTLKACGCSFCLSCVQQYLTINIQEGNVTLSCPDSECEKDGLVQSLEVEELVERNIYDMFERFKLIQDVHLDPTRTWCPTPDCETICPLIPSAEIGRGVPVTCPNCRLKFCSLCMERWHSKKTCEEVQQERQEEEELLMVQDDDPIIKRCPNPNCRVPIERDEGCAQMMCKRCKHVFCWYCLTSLDDDFLLRHYDKGPCKNKLGHSRASVVWHRTQVVGIFAGFGFLLLVASPLLLLAAPCLLCCRCKNCTKFFDEEPTAV